MYITVTELVFPTKAIGDLATVRGSEWKRLVASVTKHPENQAAFSLMMARLNNCLKCNVDSFRSIQGCSACSQQVLRRFRGTDQELIRLFEKTNKEVQSQLSPS